MPAIFGLIRFLRGCIDLHLVGHDADPHHVACRVMHGLHLLARGSRLRAHNLLARVAQSSATSILRRLPRSSGSPDRLLHSFSSLLLLACKVVLWLHHSLVERVQHLLLHKTIVLLRVHGKLPFGRKWCPLSSRRAHSWALPHFACLG